MNLALRRFKVYLKLTLIGATALVLLIVVLMNRKNEVDFWFLRQYEKVNVLYIILISAVASVLLFWDRLALARHHRRDAGGPRERRMPSDRPSRKRIADDWANARNDSTESAPFDHGGNLNHAAARCARATECPVVKDCP